MSKNDFGSFSYEVLGIIGKGGTSTVYKIRGNGDNMVYAMKEIEVDQLSTTQVAAIQAEIRTLENLSNPNIVLFYGMKADSAKFRIFMEYAEYGSLRIFYKNYGHLTTIEAQYCVRQIVDGLEYLHLKGVAHRDIKCANCLIFQQDSRVKLADFGASKRIEHESIISGLKGTPQWMAPEVIKGTQRADGWINADIWSLGCTIVEMVTAKLPYAQYNNPMTAMYRIASGELPQIEQERLAFHSTRASTSEQLQDRLMIDFIHGCCTVDPVQRPTISQIKLLPWLISTGAVSDDISSVSRLFSHQAPVTLITAQSANAAGLNFSLPRAVSSDEEEVDLGIEVDEEVEDEDDALAHSYRSPTKKNTSSSSASASSLPNTANRTYRSHRPNRPGEQRVIDWEQAVDCDESVASETSERTVERQQATLRQRQQHQQQQHQLRSLPSNNLMIPSEEEYYMDYDEEEVADDEAHDDVDAQHRHLHRHFEEEEDEHGYHDDFDEGGDHQPPPVLASSNNTSKHMDDDQENNNNISQLTGFGEDQEAVVDDNDFEVLYRQSSQHSDLDPISPIRTRPTRKAVEYAANSSTCDQSVLSAVSAPAALQQRSNQQNSSPRPRNEVVRSKLAAKLDSDAVGALFADPAYATMTRLVSSPSQSFTPTTTNDPPFPAPTTQVQRIYKQSNNMPNDLTAPKTRRAPSTAEGIPSSHKHPIMTGTSSSTTGQSKSQGKLVTLKSQREQPSKQQQPQPQQQIKPAAMRVLARANQQSSVNPAVSTKSSRLVPGKGNGLVVSNNVQKPILCSNNNNSHCSSNQNSNQANHGKLRSRSAGVYLSPVAQQKQFQQQHQQQQAEAAGRRMEVLVEGHSHQYQYRQLQGPPPPHHYQQQQQQQQHAVHERAVRTAPAHALVEETGSGLSVLITDPSHQPTLSSLSANAKKLAVPGNRFGAGMKLAPSNNNNNNNNNNGEVVQAHHQGLTAKKQRLSIGGGRQSSSSQAPPAHSSSNK